MATVLVADDAAFMRTMLREILEEAGHRVVGEAESGDEAVRLYGTLKPDLVTLDVIMPGASGVVACREILADHARARILMVSSISQMEIVDEALQLGARGYVVKPFDPERVKEAAAKALVP